MAASSPCVVVANLVREFFPRRGLVLAGVGPPPLGGAGAPAAGAGGPGGGASAAGAGGPGGGPPPPPPDDHRVIGDLERLAYVRLDALREAPRGRRDRVVVLVLAAKGKFAHHAPDLRALLGAVLAERGMAERLDELVVVAEDDFFARKPLLELALGRGEPLPEGGRRPPPPADPADPAGERPFRSAFYYRNFVLVVPDHIAVPAHRVLGPEEGARMLREGRLARADLPVIFANDPPMVWAGARAGQIVEITTDSLTAGVAVYHRRVEAPVYDRPLKGKKAAAPKS